MVVLGSPGVAGALQTRTRNDQVTVGTNSIVVAPVRNTRPPRKALVIRNNSTLATQIISISFGDKKAINGNGLVLRQYESFTDSQSGEELTGYMPDQSQVNAISTVAGGILSIFER